MGQQRYERMHLIATGGMSDVYLGRALGIGGFERLVALKTMHPNLTADRKLVSVFLNQAQLAANVRHPNVVSVLDVEADGSNVCLVLEYVEGPSLEQLLASLIASGEPMSLSVSLRIVFDSLSGLQAIHELQGAGGIPLNIIHHNLSPGSILVGVDGNSRITDFGVPSSHLAGTAAAMPRHHAIYSAPEARRRETVDLTSDLYAMGVILWELLTHRDFSKLESPFAEPSELNPEVPATFDGVCRTVLQPDPQARYQSAADFADALAIAADRAGVRPAPKTLIAQIVQDSEDEQPTRMQRNEDDPSRNGSGGSSRPPRAPLTTMLLDSQGDGEIPTHHIDNDAAALKKAFNSTIRLEEPDTAHSPPPVHHPIAAFESDDELRTMLAPAHHAPQADASAPTIAHSGQPRVVISNPTQPAYNTTPLAAVAPMGSLAIRDASSSSAVASSSPSAMPSSMPPPVASTPPAAASALPMESFAPAHPGSAHPYPPQYHPTGMPTPGGSSNPPAYDASPYAHDAANDPIEIPTRKGGALKVVLLVVAIGGALAAGWIINEATHRNPSSDDSAAATGQADPASSGAAAGDLSVAPPESDPPQTSPSDAPEPDPSAPPEPSASASAPTAVEATSSTPTSTPTATPPAAPPKSWPPYKPPPPPPPPAGKTIIRDVPF